MTIYQTISILSPIVVALAAALVSYGVLKAKTNGYAKEIERLDKTKAERDVMIAEFNSVAQQFKSMNEKLDLILDFVQKKRK